MEIAFNSADKLNLYSGLLSGLYTYVRDFVSVLNHTAEPELFPAHRRRGLTAASIAEDSGYWESKWTPRQVGTALRDLGVGPVERCRDHDRRNLRVWSLPKLILLCRSWSDLQGDTHGTIEDLVLPEVQLKTASDKAYRDKNTTSALPYITTSSDSDYIDIVKDIFLTKPCDVDVIEEEYWSGFSAYLPAMIQFSQRLLDTAEIQPDRCLTIDNALDRAGYPNLTVGLINKINGYDPIFTFDVEKQDFTHLAIEHFPANALTRIVCMTAYPKDRWLWTRGTGALKLGDDDPVAHHKCRTRNCINPLHLMPVDQYTHRKMHQADNDFDHPAIAQENIVEFPNAFEH